VDDATKIAPCGGIAKRSLPPARRK
jgi:hypothetical protein